MTDEQKAMEYYQFCLKQSGDAATKAYNADQELQESRRHWQKVCTHEFGQVYSEYGYPPAKMCKKCHLEVEANYEH